MTLDPLQKAGRTGGELPAELRDKYLGLVSHLRGYPAVIVAFSGGVDSAFLLRAAKDAGGAVRAVLGWSPSVADEVRARAERVASSIGVELEIRETRELELPQYQVNSPDRCYHCKSELYDLLGRLAQESAGENLLDGTNADDLHDLRPGLRAIRERGVKSPLSELGWSKDEIRRVSRWLGLETWDRPASPCLSSRIPHGTPITVEALERIGVAERSLHELGFEEVRVRHHGDLARIEVPPAAFLDLLRRRDEVLSAARRAGYVWVTLDLAGYRTGGADA
jgi:uncharacterized protein